MNISKSLVKMNASLSKSLARPLSTTNVISTANGSFKFEDLQLNLNKTKPNLPEDITKIPFGRVFTDHMFVAEWSAKDGWGKPVIKRLEELKIHPAAKCFHYSVEIFEGMKGYYGVDGKVRLFRPDLNAARFKKSALRSTLPDFDKQEFIKCLKKLVSIEKDWIPKSTSASLYLRPTFIGTEPELVISSSSTALMYILAGPVGPYFPTGFKPITLLADPQYVRAFPGGVGNFKCGSNYGPTIYVGIEAQKKGCQQVLWLYGPDELVTEAGTMNIFFVVKNKTGETELITPPLDGTILEGVNRQSIIDLGNQWHKIKVSVRPISMKEVIHLIESKQLLEVFGAGTSCVTSPIEAILYKDKKYFIPTMSEGAPVMSRFSNQLSDIQYGRVQHEWGVLVD